MKPLTILSLFDGMSCGRIALECAGIPVKAYYASEIDKHAIKVSNANWNDVTQIGDVTKIAYNNGVLRTERGNFNVGKIDLVLGGSPCQGFSIAGKQLAFDDPRSMLYFIFEKILKEINPEYFLLENVRMKKEHQALITQRLGVAPIGINSKLVSAQNRNRLYWANINGIIQPKDMGIMLKDILDTTVDDKYFIKDGRLQWLKSFGELKESRGYVAFNPNKDECLTARSEPRRNCTYIIQMPRGNNNGGLRALDGKTPSLTASSRAANNFLLNDGLVRKITPEECEKLQTVPVGYTKCVSDSQRYKMLGNGWTVDVIAHILKGIVHVRNSRT